MFLSIFLFWKFFFFHFFFFSGAGGKQKTKREQIIYLTEDIRRFGSFWVIRPSICIIFVNKLKQTFTFWKYAGMVWETT